MNSETVAYIVRFLLHGNDALARRVGYTSDATLFGHYSVVVVPSQFWNDGIFGTLRAEPVLPLSEIDGVPLLFGAPHVERLGDTIVVYADIVASAFFLLSRYEEWLHPHDLRDMHGRFVGRHSLAARAGFIHRPIVDEYGALLRKWLRDAGCAVREPAPGFEAVYLTHDVDTIAFYRHVRGFLGGIKRALFGHNVRLADVLRAQKSLQHDAAYTFPWLMAQDAMVPQAHAIYFFKAAVETDRFDYPQYNLRGGDARQLVAFLRDNGCEIGLHASYFSGTQPAVIPDERQKLQEALQQPVTANRWHYLRTLQPADFGALVQAGITDDFTMGYADVAGFRLGTCRAVRWIDAQTGTVTPLVLHPLTVMDCTLSNTNYMNLQTEDEAYFFCEQLFDKVRQYAGDITLLWHNSIFKSNTTNNNNESINYHTTLYPKLLKGLRHYSKHQ